MGHFVGIATPLSLSHATIVGWCIRVFLLGAPAVYRMGTHISKARSCRFLNLRWMRLYSSCDGKVSLHGRVSIRFRRVSSGASSPGTHTMPHLQIHPMTPNFCCSERADYTSVAVVSRWRRVAERRHSA